MIDAALQFLTQTQNPDGGWGAKKDKRSNTEATSLALLALSAFTSGPIEEKIKRALNWLITRQNPDGSWPLADSSKERSWTTALATLSLAHFTSHLQNSLLGAAWLVGQKGESGFLLSLLYRLAPQKISVKLNPLLTGWPWTIGTFSWVEPTAYSLIALKKVKPYLKDKQAIERIRQGEMLIYDRMCKGGGWNYGNSEVLGENLWPYPDTTALALIALQDHLDSELNQLSIKSLKKMLTENQSGLAISWSIICFFLYGDDPSPWKETLKRNYEKTGFLGETKPIALALLAAGAGAEVFRI